MLQPILPTKRKTQATRQSLPPHERAAILRDNPSAAERALWRQLRKSQLGVLFRHRAVVMAKIPAFFAPEIGLAIDLVGRQWSGDTEKHDQLRKHGIRVVTIDANRVLADIDAVVEEINQTIEEIHSISGEANEESDQP